MKRLIIAALSVSIASCSGARLQQGTNQAQTCTDNASYRALAEGALLGALGGAAVGAGAGQLADKKAGVGAAAGGAIGTLAGLLYAYSVENQYQEARCQEANLDKAIGVTQHLNQTTLSMNQSLEKYLNALSGKIDSANRDSVRRQAALAELKTEKAELYQVQASVQQRIAETEKVLKELNAWKPPPSAKSQLLSSEIVKLEAQNELLRGKARTLAALGQRI